MNNVKGRMVKVVCILFTESVDPPETLKVGDVGVISHVSLNNKGVVYVARAMKGQAAPMYVTELRYMNNKKVVV